jgi:hypothetical protein
MSAFHEWDNVIGAAGFRDALLAYGRARGDIGPAGKLPKDDLKHLAEAAIRSGVVEFSLETASKGRGSVHVHAFAGYHWAYDSGSIHGPFYSLEKAAQSVLKIASLAAPSGFYKHAYGKSDDAFIATRAVNLVDVGDTFVINGTMYIRTDAGLVPKV